VPTNSFPMAGVREFANRLMLNVYQKWPHHFTPTERDVLCYFISNTIGRGRESEQFEPKQSVARLLSGLYQDGATPTSEVLIAAIADINASIKRLGERGVLIIEEQGTGYEVMVNLRWKPQA
jgi:hypothetical protein